jgi:hypothetical protein
MKRNIASNGRTSQTNLTVCFYSLRLKIINGKQFGYFSGNVILSKICGWKWQKYLKKNECNVELLIVAQHITQIICNIVH